MMVMMVVTVVVMVVATVVANVCRTPTQHQLLCPRICNNALHLPPALTEVLNCSHFINPLGNSDLLLVTERLSKLPKVK